MSSIRLRRHATMMTVAATAAASWALVTQGVGVHLGIQLPHSAPSTLGLGRTVAVATAAAAIGWAVLVVAERRLRHPRRSWVAAAGAAFVASLALPLGFATTTAATVSLVAIHIAVAAVAIAGLAPTATAHRLREPALAAARVVPPTA